MGRQSNKKSKITVPGIALFIIILYMMDPLWSLLFFFGVLFYFSYKSVSGLKIPRNCSTTSTTANKNTQVSKKYDSEEKDTFVKVNTISPSSSVNKSYTNFTDKTYTGKSVIKDSGDDWLAQQKKEERRDRYDLNEGYKIKTEHLRDHGKF